MDATAEETVIAPEPAVVDGGGNSPPPPVELAVASALDIVTAPEPSVTALELVSFATIWVLDAVGDAIPPPFALVVAAKEPIVVTIELPAVVTATTGGGVMYPPPAVK